MGQASGSVWHASFDEACLYIGRSCTLNARLPCSGCGWGSGIVPSAIGQALRTSIR